MSYSFTLNFAKAKNFQEAFKLAIKVADSAWNSTRQIIETNEFYIPAIRNDAEPSALDKFWLESAMSLDFIYWPTENLLALSGGEWPESMLRKMPRQVHFQNGTDQDYSPETWLGICSLCNYYVAQYVNASKKKLEDVFKRHYEDPSFEIEQEELGKLDYYRRWACYASIYDALGLEDWLYGRDNPVFIRFRLCALNTPEKSDEAYRLLRAFVNKRRAGERIKK